MSKTLDKLTQAQADLVGIRLSLRERSDIDFNIDYAVSVLCNAVIEVEDQINDAIQQVDSLSEPDNV